MEKLQERASSSLRRPTRSSERSPLNMFLGLLGGFELRLGNQVVFLPLTAQRLLVFLALHRRSLTRTYVSQSLWLEATERRANGNLRSALWKIGRVGSGLVDMRRGCLTLSPLIRVDLHRSVALAHKLLAEGQSLDATELDEGMLREDLLPDWYEDWVLVERDRYRQLRLHALESLCLQLILLGRFAHAVQAGLAVVAAEPLRESANLVLIRAYLEEGNACEALRQYRSYRSLLQDELGVSPSAAITQVVARLSSHL